VEYRRLILPVAITDWFDQALAYPGVRLLDLTPHEATTRRSSFTSGGLGLARTDWERVHQKTGSTLATGYSITVDTYNNEYAVLYNHGKVWCIELARTSNLKSNRANYQVTSQQLIPVDAQLIESTVPDPRTDTIINLYFSDSLKQQFTEQEWPGEERGYFTVRHSNHGLYLHSLVISAGKFPFDQ